MEKSVDYKKTRRRIEEALRKTPEENVLVDVAKLLNVKIAYFDSALNIPEIEKQLADVLMENPALRMKMGNFKVLCDLLPMRFTVYCVCIDGECRTRYYFTKEAAEAHIPGANYYVKAESLNLIDMRKLIKTTEVEWSSHKYKLTPEEKELFKELKSITR